MAENESSDLIILDIMLPIMDGMAILTRVRKAGIRTPILMLTARDALTDKVVTPLAIRKGIMINLSEKKQALILGDHFALLELFVNVLDNAIKYNVQEGKIDIAIVKERGLVITEIRDTGIGISDEELDKVFDRFYRADKSRSREAGGIGLGLSICEEIVKLHGGRIEMKSEIGMGTTVSVCLNDSKTVSPQKLI